MLRPLLAITNKLLANLRSHRINRTDFIDIIPERTSHVVWLFCHRENMFTLPDIVFMYVVMDGSDFFLAHWEQVTTAIPTGRTFPAFGEIIDIIFHTDLY